ncbi:gliding motility-associated C-terminal domain-containing protein [Tenacibaculum aiptasiae]|uniref:gliding motility-associated C-terminal domain-containing protein n=1 Tax=Tenacibaculum aiptasiae TaxID=426481 RepID=UPI003B5B9A3F
MLLRSTLLIFLFCFIFISNKAFSQCAGANNSITICNKDADPNYQNFNLFNQLNGVPENGGTWTANTPINQHVINKTTGIVNLWAINRFGEHKFTYTNPKCGESAEITILLGGYPGEDNVDGGANACSDNSTVDLFTFLDNDLINLSADINGQWSPAAGTPTGLLTDNYFNAQAAGVGTYTFTYTVDKVDTCNAREATVVIEVHRAARAGTAQNIEICDTDDLSPYTNVNLFDYIIGGDSNGIWVDESGTGQISGPLDAIINIQEIYNNFGSGKYDFKYTVYPVHGVCGEETATVSVILPKISGEFSVQNQCRENSLFIKILHDRTLNSTMTYNLEYEIINATTNLVMYTDTLLDINIVNIDGTINSPEITLPNTTLPPGSYIIRTKSIDDIRGIICNSFTVVEDSFTINEAKAKLDNTCYDGGSIDLTIYDFYNKDGNLSNDIENVTYTIASNNTTSTITNYDINFVNGEAIIPLDLSKFPKTENDFNFKITPATENGLSCINYNFTINRIPDDIQLDLAIDNKCDASDLKVKIDAPKLTSGDYTINYKVTEVATGKVLTENTIIFSGGIANYNIDITNLDKGFYNVILKSTQNDTTPCRTKFDFEIEENFSIDGIPEAPELDANQTFCTSDFHPNLPTLADIKIKSGDNLSWYADNTTNVKLDPNTILVDGEDYFVSATSLNTNCESSKRTPVTVTIHTPQNVTSTNTTPLFCGIDKPTLANLDAVVNSGTLLWYDSLSGGNLLAPDTLLVDGVTYYATESINGCESINRLSFNVTVINPPKPQLTGTTLLCALENLTLLDFESSLTNTTGHEFIWYDASTGGTELDKADLLEEGIVYYVANMHINSGCESERTPIEVTLNNCNPEDYNFFIPDGFSPNGDGVNDFYYIPNIRYFYPDYQLEIFNRYGQLLFRGNINSPKWNGQNMSNSDVTSGVYFYILNYNRDNIKAKQGRIYLSK